MPRSLPEHPTLEALKKEAKALLKARRTEAPNEQHSLQKCQHQLALDYGIASWNELTAEVNRSSADVSVSLEERNEATIRAYCDAIERGDLEAIRELVTPDYVIHYDDQTKSHDEVMQIHMGGREKRKSERHIINDVIASGDKLSVRMTSYYVDLDGKEVKQHYSAVHRCVDGRMAESWHDLRTMNEIKSAAIPESAELQALFDSCAKGLQAGDSLISRLRTEHAAAQSDAMRRVIAEIVKTIESGRTFSEALAQHPSVFNETCVAMVRTGETLCSLEELVGQIATLHVAEQGTATVADVDQTITYVKQVLRDMCENNGATAVFRKSEPLAPVDGAGCEYAHFVNRLKLMSGLNPVTYPERLYGHFELKIGGKLHIARTWFDDASDEPMCSVTIEEMGSSRKCVVRSPSEDWRHPSSPRSSRLSRRSAAKTEPEGEQSMSTE